MNLIELDHALRKLRLSGMADVLETRLRHAQTEKLAPIDIVSTLVSDELLRRQDRPFVRRIKEARFRDTERALDSFDFDFNKKMNRALVYSSPPPGLSANARTRSFSGHPEPARATSPRPSVAPRFNRAIASCTAKRTYCWKKSPTPASTGSANSISPISPRPRC